MLSFEDKIHRTPVHPNINGVTMRTLNGRVTLLGDDGSSNTGIIALALAAIGVAGYFFVFKKKKARRRR